MLCYRDDDGEFVRAGDRIRFGYGIPPVGVVAQIVEKNGELVVISPPPHKPSEYPLKSLRRAVGGFYKEAEKKQYITEEMLRSGSHK